MKKIIAFLKNKKGIASVDLIVTTAILCAAFFSFLFIFPIFSTQAALDLMAKDIVHTAEIYGSIGSEVDASVNELQASQRLTIDTITWDTTYHNPALRTVQLKTPIKVTISKNIDIPIFKPVFSDSYPFHITLTATATGISEVYYKP